METAVVASAITVMGIMILLGYFLSSKIHITAETKQVLVVVVLNIAVPSVILNGVFNTDVSDQLLGQIGIIFLLSIGFHLAALAFALLFAKIMRFESVFAKRITILAALGNTGFIGIPLCMTIFGPTGGLLAAIFDAGLDLVIFTVGLFLLQSDRGFRLNQLKALLNIPLAAVIVGVTSAFLNAEPPAVIRQLVELLSGLAAPLAMLYIGILLQQLLKRTGLQVFPQIWFPLTVRLLMIPALTLLILYFLPLEELTRNVVILLSGMPTFMLAAILFSRYTDEEDTAVITISFSTILSLLTIPLVAFAANFFF